MTGIANPRQWRLMTSLLPLILIVVAVLVLPAGAHAQMAPVTLVSNTGQPGDAGAILATDHGQAFTTGYNLTGYTVSSVVFFSWDEHGDDIDLQICGVGADGNPTTSCTDLTPPDSFPRGRLVFNAPTDTTLTLASRTTYMVVFKNPGGNYLSRDVTSRDGEDSSSLPGWEVANHMLWKSPNGWTEERSGFPLRIAINGTTNPPSATAPTASDSTVTATEDTAYAFAATDFSFSATADGDMLASVRVVTLPALGTLTLDGSAVSMNQSVAKTQLDNGGLVYTPPADGSGTGYTSFRFRVSGGSEASSLSYSMTIDVTGVEDPGAVALSHSTPVVGRLLTATLTDPDGGVTGRTWTWSWSTTRTGSFTTISGADTATYTPAPADDGRYLKASATYTDSFGGNQSAAETSANTPGTTLVSNTGQGGDASARFTTDHGQAFTTGYNLTGYTVSSVEIISEDWPGDDIALQICGVGADGSPTTSCTDLTAPNSFARGTLVFNVPTGTTLTPSTTYMVVFKSPGGDRVDVDATSSDGEDSSAFPDWSIRNRSQFKDSNGWHDRGYDIAVRIAIGGEVNPPSATAPTASDSTVTATEDTAYAFAATDFSFSATADGDMLASVRVVTLPALGTLTLDGSAVSVNQSVAKTQLDNGGLVYTPPADGSGTGYTSFRFRVSGGSGTSADAYLMTIDVTGVEDPGAVALSRSTPVVGRLLTATLTDPDGGVTGRTWTWSWSTTRTGSFTPIVGADTATYTPAPADDGRYLKASATYTDSFGGNQSAAETSANTPAGTTLVSNTGQGGDASARFTTDYGQAFTTGYNLTDYTVSSVEIISQDSQSDDIALQICGVGADGSPTTSCTDLTAPNSFARGTLVFNVPTGTTLTPSTTYMVVFKSPGGDRVDVDATSSDDEDAGSLTDWEVRDLFQWNNAGTWQNASGSRAIRIAIVGTVNPPSSTAPTAMDSTVTATEDTAYAFAAADFSFSATADDDTLASVRILTLPAKGTFTLSGMAVTANQSVAKAQLDAQNLVYTPPADGSGTGYASFRFRVSGGSGTSADAYSMTIDVTGTQDAATGAPTFSGSAKVGLVLTAITTGLQDPDGVANITTYQWIRVDGDGTSNPTNVGTNSNRYALSEADFGKRIKVRVDFTDGLGGAESRTSAVYPSDGTVQRIKPVLVPQTWGGAPRSGNQPIFGIGEQYRLLLLTGVRVIERPTDSNNRKDGAFYNHKVAEWVGKSPTLDPYKDGFTALVSTTGDSSANPPVPPAIARDNTETTGTGVPIYWYRGAKVADDYADFYDASWDNGDANDHHGHYLYSYSYWAACAWTGSTSSGMPSDRPLGSRDYINLGCAWADGDEIDRNVNNYGRRYVGFYALSPVFQVDTPPTSSNGTVTTNEGTDYVFAAADFSYADSEGEPLASVIITGLPAAGTVKVGNTVIRDRDWLPWTFTVGELGDGRLKYDPPTDTYGTGYASFKFRVNDGTSDSAEHTMTIDVTAVEDPGTVALSVGSPAVDRPLTATLTDPDGGVTGESWTWSWSTTRTGSFTPIVGANTATYTPVTADEGRFLMASVTYTDSFGANQSATQTAANATAASSPPVFPKTSETFRVNELATSGRVGAVTVTDPNNESIRYTVSGGPDVTDFNEDFSLDSSSGQITVKSNATIDYETNQWYMVTVTATNSASDTATVAVTIDVTNVREGGTLTLSPSTPVVGKPLTATLTDPDGIVTIESWTWTWGTTRKGWHRTISGANTATYIPVPADAHRFLRVRVLYVDGYGPNNGGSRVMLYPVEPNSPPVFANPLETFRVNENATSGTVGTVTATDPDNESISYSVSGGPDEAEFNEDFSLDSSSGEITVKSTATIDHENQPSYTVTITARDTADVTATVTVTIEATDLNDPATGVPTISGAAQVGQTLTASTGGIADQDGLPGVFAYQWKRYAADGSTFEANIGDNASTYTLTESDEGKKVTVEVSFTDSGGSSEGPLVSAAYPSSETVGAARQGRTPPGASNSTVSTDEDTDHTFAAADFNYLNSDGANLVSVKITGLPAAGTGTLALDGTAITSTDLPKTVTATELGESSLTYTARANTNGAGYSSFTFKVNDGTADSVSEYAMTINVSPVNDPATGRPTISGSLQVGETLTASTAGISDIDGTTNASYSYRWMANDGSSDADLPDATDSVHTLVAGDAGKTIKVRVSFTDDAGNEETLTSAATAEVAAGAPADPPGHPRNLTGVANSDGTVTLSWEAPNDGTVTGYQILRRRPSEGENTLLVHVNDTRNTATEYTDSAVTPAVLHAYRVKAINAVGLSSQSNFVNVTPGQPTEPAQNSPATGTPQISGTAQVGETLTASTSGIADSDGLNNAAFSYRWIRNDGSTDTDIQDTTGASHTLVDADEGRTIKVEVNFADDAGNAETLTSAATTSVAARPNSPATGAPTISGTAQVGERLTADTSGIEDDDGLDDAAFAHQWLADGAEINGATAATYTLVAADAGKAIKVQVSFTDDAGNDEEITSAATAAVAEAEPAGPPPAPRNLTAVVNGDGHVVLSWEAPEDDSITGYQILRRRPTEGEDTLLVYVEDTQSTATTYTDRDVTAGVQHAYRVRAINAAGASPVSNFVDPTP